MHRAVGEEYPAQAVGFQPVAIEEDEAFAGLAFQLQPLAHLIKILAVGGSETERSISSLASSSHWLWFICVRVMGCDVLPPRKLNATSSRAMVSRQPPARYQQVPRAWRRRRFGSSGPRRVARLRPGALRLRPGVEQFDGEIRIELQHAARHGDDNVVDIVVAEGFAQHAQILVEVAVG
jgi:hypothetical protein